MRILAALTLLVCAACGAREPAAPDAATEAASDSAFVAEERGLAGHRSS